MRFAGRISWLRPSSRSDPLRLVCIQMYSGLRSCLMYIELTMSILLRISKTEPFVVNNPKIEEVNEIIDLNAYPLTYEILHADI